MTAVEVLQWTTRVAFVALAVLAFVEWRRTRHHAAGWLTASFAVMGAVILAGLVTPDEPEGLAGEAATRAVVSLLLLFPYFLYRFSESFEQKADQSRMWASVGTVAIIVATIAVPDFPSDDQAQPVAFTVYVIFILAVWSALSAAVAWRLWIAGRDEPRLARRRMRLLGMAAIVLTLALVLSGAAGGSDDDAVVATVQIGALVSALMFLVGFAPPTPVRLWWRRRETDALRQAELSLIQAREPQDVLDILLPNAAALVGARDVEFRAGQRPTDPRSIGATTTADDVVTIDLQSGQLVVHTSPYAPLFGDEELQLLQALGVVADLALERSRLFTAERDARREAERSNAELEQFAYSASHDLKAPLGVLNGFVQILDQRHRDALGTSAEYLDTMTQTIGRMSALIDDLLALSRIGRNAPEVEFEAVPLADVVSDALANLAGEISTSNAHVEIDPSLPKVRADRSLAVMVVQNLVGNAIKYSGGRRPEVRIVATANRDGITVEVADRGEGIDSTKLDEIFAPFVRLHSGDGAPEGTGIGLAMVKKAVEVHGGEISAESEPGRGSTFRFTLPAA